MTQKSFDAVEMKRQGAQRIYEETRGMTLEEQLEYWAEATRALEELQQSLRDEDHVRNPRLDA